MTKEKNIPLQLPPGVYRQGTEYQARGRWFDADGVRWHSGVMQPIGGWQPVLDNSTTPTAVEFEGTPRAALAWKSNAELALLAVGSTASTSGGAVTGSLELLIDGEVIDITPADLVPGAVDGAYVGFNYGGGPYGGGYFGTGQGAASLAAPDTWQLDNFGEQLVAVYTADGRILWKEDPTNDDVATALEGAPIDNRGVVVTPERFVVALGANGDGRTVAWPDQESLTDWTPSSTNQAGEFPLPTKGTLRCGRRTRRQTLLWTDVDMYAMTYVGGDFIYVFEQLGDGCGIIGPNACVVLGDMAIWMGKGGFFGYDGALAPIPCDVEDYIFLDLDFAQADKIACVPCALFNEVTWHYPSKTDGTYENSRYATYNWKEKHWSIGKLARAAGVDAGVHENPILIDPTGGAFAHEKSQSRGTMVPFAESGPVEIAEGDNVMQVQKIIPDQKTLGALELTLFARRSPTGAERSAGPYNAANPTSVRITGREVRLRVVEVSPEQWNFGVPRLTVVLGGRR